MDAAVHDGQAAEVSLLAMDTSGSDDLLALQLLPLRFTLRTRTTLQLPRYKGSTLRGGFGTAFKQTVCVVEHRDCSRCLLRTTCAYPYVFETPVPDDARRMRKYTAAPHPFVLLPPLEPKTRYEPGECLHVDWTLIGNGAQYLPNFIYAFEQLGAQQGLGKGRGRFTLDEVNWLPPRAAPVAIYRSEDQVLHHAFRLLDVRDFAAPSDVEAGNRLTLHFLTPTRLVYQGSLTDTPAFHVILRTLLRRLSNLAYFHCGTVLQLDFRGLIDKAKEVGIGARRLQWYDWERYSARQQVRMKMGGFVGHVTYVGDLAPFLPFLRLGAMVHIGKGAAFGLGKYAIVSEDPRPGSGSAYPTIPT